MNNYNRRIQEYIEEYRRTVKDGRLTAREIAVWLLRTRKCKPSIGQAVAVLSKDVAQALRTQYTTDPDGRRVRRKYAVRYKETLADGGKRQMTFWYDRDIAPPQFMYESFQQMRAGLANGCWQLKKNVDSYNKFLNKTAPIQVVFDFREDNAEREAAGDYGSGEDEETPEV